MTRPSTSQGCGTISGNRSSIRGSRLVFIEEFGCYGNTAARQCRHHIRTLHCGLKHSSESAGDQVKEGFIESYENLADAFSKAENELSSGDSGKSGD
jgi:hypothetical protein